MESCRILIRLFKLPSILNAGNLLDTTLTRHPFVLGGVPLSLYAIISGGVLSSLPSQNGQYPPLIGCGSVLKSVGLIALSVAMITHRPEMGSFRSSGIFCYPPMFCAEVIIFVTVLYLPHHSFKIFRWYRKTKYRSKRYSLDSLSIFHELNKKLNIYSREKI